MSDNQAEFLDEDDASLGADVASQFSQAVLYSSDWTVETVLTQVTKGNIDLNPRFQRRDAWTRASKSRFIESIILGLPIPQIVLAEKPSHRGQFIVLDGKQRLLALLQFTGKGEGDNNAFKLQKLEVRSPLIGRSYGDLETDPQLQTDYNAFLNHTIRAVVIRNWPSLDFLHVVFLRLNTGTQKLSPQELRQAAVPGHFTTFADDYSYKSTTMKTLLSRQTPDPRMRDVELLVRYYSFKRFIESYSGRLKKFLDTTCERLNEAWDVDHESIKADAESFSEGVLALIEAIGVDRLARKPGSKSFNRAIFDALIFYAARDGVAAAIRANAAQVSAEYEDIFNDPNFAEAIESDTAGIPNTQRRISLWGDRLRAITQMALPHVDLVENDGRQRIILR